MQIERADNFMRSLGVEAYRVGGSVRDEIIGRRPKDPDYMVRGVSLAALGDHLNRVRPQTGRLRPARPLKLRDGRQVGWRVGEIEVVLPRREVSTGTGRRDFRIEVDPGLSLAEDATRRDFTFNALFKDVHTDEIIDPLGGVDDLMHKTVRTTHPDSFRDDPLRTLRALRFVSVLGYDLAATTWGEMRTHAGAVDGLTTKLHTSGTVAAEMDRLLMGADVEKALWIMVETGVMSRLFPELNRMVGFEQKSRYHDMTTDAHTFKALNIAAKADAPLRVRWALLFHDAGKPESAWIGTDGRMHYYSNGDTEDHEVTGERLWRLAARRMNVPGGLRKDVSTLILNHMVTLEGRFKPSRVRQMRVKFGDEILRDLLLHRACDVAAKGKPNPDHLDRIAEMEEERQRASDAGVPAGISDLKIDGHDAQQAGLRGQQIGEALKSVLAQVAAEPGVITMSQEWQMAALRRWGG
jgi:tRNA nucleotidyltransferase/poly(A) polymerase